MCPTPVRESSLRKGRAPTNVSGQRSPGVRFEQWRFYSTREVPLEPATPGPRNQLTIRFIRCDDRRKAAAQEGPEGVCEVCVVLGYMSVVCSYSPALIPVPAPFLVSSHPPCLAAF